MKSKKTILITLSIIFLLIFIFILIQISLNKIFLINWDLKLNSFVPKIENNFLTQLSIIIAFIFDNLNLLIISIIISVFLWTKDKKRESVFFIIAILLTSGLVFLIKNLIQRARPLNGIVNESGFAFPSGHATMAIVFFGVLVYLILMKNKSKVVKQLILIISIFMVGLISFSRIYLNAHWLTDVIGGVFLGLFILLTSIIIYETTT